MGTEEEEMHDRRALNATMLTLLEENRDGIKSLSVSVDETKTMVTNLNAHFIGILPGDHIKHHIKFADDDKNKTELSIAKRTVIVSLIVTALAGLGSILYTVVTNHFKLEFITQIVPSK